MIHQIELNVIRFIQTFLFTDEYNILDKIAKLISSRKYRRLYLILYFLIFIISKEYSKILIVINLYILSFLSRKLNIFIKLIFKRKRPFNFNNILTDKKTNLKKVDTYSMPSNSIQTSLIFYNILLSNTAFVNYQLKIYILVIIIIILSLAKILRGLHFPSDILVSLIISYICTVSYEVFLKNFDYKFNC